MSEKEKEVFVMGRKMSVPTLIACCKAALNADEDEAAGQGGGMEGWETQVRSKLIFFFSFHTPSTHITASWSWRGTPLGSFT